MTSSPPALRLHTAPLVTITKGITITITIVIITITIVTITIINFPVITITDWTCLLLYYITIGIIIIKDPLDLKKQAPIAEGCACNFWFHHNNHHQHDHLQHDHHQHDHDHHHHDLLSRHAKIADKTSLCNQCMCCISHMLRLVFTITITMMKDKRQKIKDSRECHNHWNCWSA